MTTDIEIRGAARLRSPDLIDRLAAQYKVDASCIEAVLEVETAGRGYDEQGRLICLPEKHVFYRLVDPAKRRAALKARVAATRWDAANYAGLPDYAKKPETAGDKRWALLARMAAIGGAEAAYGCASWGLPQILGCNAESIGYASAEAMVRAFADGEDAQIEGMLKFIEQRKAMGHLRARNWVALAEIYNGRGQARHDYAGRLARAEAKARARKAPPRPAGVLGSGDSGPEVRALQERLAGLRYPVGAQDGRFGRLTRNAVLAFQADHGLPATGDVDAATLAAIKIASPAELGPRAETTEATLVAGGSRTAWWAVWLRRAGQALAGTSALGLTAPAAVDVLPAEGPGEIAGWLGTLRASVAAIAEHLAWLFQPQHLMLATVLLGLWLALGGHRIVRARLDDAVNGLNLGR